jgi:hypothetical protein
MPWTMPNFLLQEKPVPLGNMRSLGCGRVFVYCGADVRPSWNYDL